MKIFFIIVLVLIASLTIGGCMQAESQTFEFDFSKGTHDWTGDFADYPPGEEVDIYELEFGYDMLPPELGKTARALKLQGHNRSDDLFMFIKGQIADLKPDTRYQVVIEVEFATDAPAGAVGIGGAPGESVYVKVGATTQEPKPVLTDMSNVPFLIMNIDKDNQSGSGRDAIVVGDAAKVDNDEFDVYEFKTLNNKKNPMTVHSDADGKMWIIVGTDSGFEGRTVIYYSSVKVTVTEK